MVDKNFPRALSAKYKEDFAYPSVKDRIPVILTKVIDYFYRLHGDIKDKHGEDATEELKEITGRLSKLKNEVQTNKPILPVTDGLSDMGQWAQAIEADTKLQTGGSAWFASPWLFTECFFYRKVWESIQLSSSLKYLDPYGQQKQTALSASITAIQQLTIFLDHVKSQHIQRQDKRLAQYFAEFLQIALWGNKCDLSISAGTENSQQTDPVEQLSKLTPNILANNTSDVWKYLNNKRSDKGDDGRIQLDIVLDNAGFELFTDLCLAEFLVSSDLAHCVRFHGKRMPWFVSDVTEEDFQWTLDTLAGHKDNQVAALGRRFQKLLQTGTWVYTSHDFWTLPHDFAAMNTVSPDLYNELGSADLVIFKGDLNYRKLTGDLTWPHTTPFSAALRGFLPAPLVSLRTLKSDLVVGLQEGKAEEIKAADKDWLVNGAWAVVQFCST